MKKKSLLRKLRSNVRCKSNETNVWWYYSVPCYWL